MKQEGHVGLIALYKVLCGSGVANSRSKFKANRPHEQELNIFFEIDPL